MNNSIQNIIQQYFTDNTIKPAGNRRIKINEAILKYKRTDTLFESCHESMIFNSGLNDICTQILENTEDTFYTGWNYCRHDNQCYNHNDENKDIPIYIHKSYEISHIFAEIINRDINDPICNNAIIINVYMNNIKGDNFLKASLKHELIHALEMYINDTYNILDSPKNT